MTTEHCIDAVTAWHNVNSDEHVRAKRVFDAMVDATGGAVTLKWLLDYAHRNGYCEGQGDALECMKGE